MKKSSKPETNFYMKSDSGSTFLARSDCMWMTGWSAKAPPTLLSSWIHRLSGNITQTKIPANYRSVTYKQKSSNFFLIGVSEIVLRNLRCLPWKASETRPRSEKQRRKNVMWILWKRNEGPLTWQTALFVLVWFWQASWMAEWKQAAGRDEALAVIPTSALMTGTHFLTFPPVPPSRACLLCRKRTRWRLVGPLLLHLRPPPLSAAPTPPHLCLLASVLTNKLSSLSEKLSFTEIFSTDDQAGRDGTFERNARFLVYCSCFCKCALTRVLTWC